MNECGKISEIQDRLEVVESKLDNLEKQIGQSYNQSEAARYLGISRPTLRAHMKYGLISPIPGTRTRFLKKELDRYKNLHPKS